MATKKATKKQVAPSTLGEDFPEEQARLRDLLGFYQSIPEGGFAATIIKSVLREADAAAASGDADEMLRSYQNMRSCQ